MTDSPGPHAPEPDLELDDQLCFALYTASQAISARYRAALTATGLTYSQYLVMLVLWSHDQHATVTGGGTGDEAGVPLRHLRNRLHLDTNTLSPLVKRLEQRGLVQRTRAHADERMIHISCTPTGRSLRQRAAVAQADVVAATGLTPADKAALRTRLRELSDHLRTTTVAEPPTGRPTSHPHHHSAPRAPAVVTVRRT